MKNRIRVFRAEREWSQANLAERLGVSRQTVNAIERQRYDPSLDLAFRIAHLFDVPVERVFLWNASESGSESSAAEEGPRRLDPNVITRSP